MTGKTQTSSLGEAAGATRIRRKRLKSYDDAALVNQENRTRKTAAVPTKHFWQAFRFSHPWKSHLPASLYHCNLFCDKIPFKKKIHKLHPRKKNLTMILQKPSIWRCISTWFTWWFSIVMLALRGEVLISCNLVSPLAFALQASMPLCKFQAPETFGLNTEFMPVPSGTYRVVFSRDRHGTHHSIQRYSKRPLNPKKQKNGNNFMQKIRFFLFRTLFLSAGFAETSASFQTIGTIHQGDHTRRRSNHLGAQSFKYTNQPCCIAAWHSKKKTQFLTACLENPVPA